MSSQILSYKKKSKTLKAIILKKIEIISETIQHSLQTQESSSEVSPDLNKSLNPDNPGSVSLNADDLRINDQTSEGVDDEKLEENEIVPINNSFFFKNFNSEKLIQEVESVPWTSNRPLDYYSYSLKNLISVAGEIVSGGSKTLECYVSPYNATVYHSLKQAGAINLFNANLDEFGMSGTGIDSAFGHVSNPYNSEHIVGGSSSGSAYVVAKDLVDFSIGSDTGDSGRIPASNSNIFGFKPSYGAVSRFGFFPFCSQFDTPAILSKNLSIIAQVFSVISHSDPKDLSTLNTKPEDYTKYLLKEFDKPIKIAVFKETFDVHEHNQEDSENTKQEFSNMLEILKNDKDFEVCEISFEPELLRLFLLVYMIVAYSESVSNYSNINGLLFPYAKQTSEPNPYQKPDSTHIPEPPEDKIRSIFLDKSSNFENLLMRARKDFGKEFKLRQLLGMYFLDDKNYDDIYLQAKKLLSIIGDKVTKLFESYDAVLSPTSLSVASTIDEVENKYCPSNTQNILLIANFCGLPAINVPWIFDQQLPVGLHLFCGYKQDGLLFQIASRIVQHVEKNFLSPNEGQDSENVTELGIENDENKTN